MISKYVFIGACHVIDLILDGFFPQTIQHVSTEVCTFDAIFILIFTGLVRAGRISDPFSYFIFTFR
jgi:hypothetical protein